MTMERNYRTNPNKGFDARVIKNIFLYDNGKKSSNEFLAEPREGVVGGTCGSPT
jgi:hypothetical protein